MNNEKIKVLVSGACGRMGTAVVKAITAESDMQIVSLVDISDNLHCQFKDILGPEIKNLIYENVLKKALEVSKPDVVVDFTNPTYVYENTRTIIEAGARPVIGTTGLQPEQIKELSDLCIQRSIGGLIAPNFAIGAVLMMQFAKKAAEYFSNVEIVELHHNKKLDAPSGTAIKTAELMEQVQSQFDTDNVVDKELIKGARGAVTSKKIHIHSIRLPGLVAHQEVYLAGPGQLLTIRHDSFDRISFMPGVIKAIRNVTQQNQLIYGLENIL